MEIIKLNETKKITDQWSCSSPADKVASCDDLLTEILLRLPVRSLLRFTSVSKHWYFLVSSPSFKFFYSSRKSFPGLFIPVKTDSPCLECELIPFDIKNPVKPHIRFPDQFDANDDKIDIEHSSNGLFLCYNQIRGMFPSRYYIYNPTINQFITLPKLEISNTARSCGMTLAFDPSKSPHYKIIDVFTYFENRVRRYQIQIYSSQTRTFKPSHAFSIDKNISYKLFSGGVYWNNAIHWVPNTRFVLYFNLDQEIIHQIQTPFARIGLVQGVDTNHIFESRDHLLLVEINRTLAFKFKVHELKKNYSGWLVKYHVDLEEVGKSFPTIIKPQSRHTFEFNVLCIVLGEKEDDSFLVFEFDKKVVRFNMVSRTFHKLHDFIAVPLYDSWAHFENRVVGKLRKIYHFRESLYGV